jgi:hypothetical protein
MTEEGLGLRTTDPPRIFARRGSRKGPLRCRVRAPAPHISTIWVEHGRIVALSHDHFCGNCLRKWR